MGLRRGILTKPRRAETVHDSKLYGLGNCFLGGISCFCKSKLEQSFLFVSTLPVPLRPYLCEQLKRIQGSVDLLRKREDEEDFEQELDDIMRRSVAGISSSTPQ